MAVRGVGMRGTEGCLALCCCFVFGRRTSVSMAVGSGSFGLEG